MTDLKGPLLCPKVPQGWENNLITSRSVGGKNTSPIQHKIQTSFLTAAKLLDVFMLKTEMLGSYCVAALKARRLSVLNFTAIHQSFKKSSGEKTKAS